MRERRPPSLKVVTACFLGVGPCLWFDAMDSTEDVKQWFRLKEDWFFRSGRAAQVDCSLPREQLAHVVMERAWTHSPTALMPSGASHM